MRQCSSSIPGSRFVSKATPILESLDAYNQALSEDRALSVRDWLVDEEGVDGAGFEILGFGESRPAAPNEKADGSDDPQARQKNRRVEIVIGKKG